MISIKNVRIPFNYVLLKLDEDFDTYQINGKETNILTPTYAYQGKERIDTKHLNYAVTGTVLGIPEQIRFTRDAIKKIKASIVTKRNGREVLADGSLLRRINRLKESGCRFETENELVVGDHVRVSYQVHLKAQFFDTEEGRVCFVKYDDIYMTTSGKMVNGYILVDPELRDLKTENGVKFEEKSGLVLPKLGETYRRSAKWAVGTVVHIGKPIKGYFDFVEYNDEEIDLNTGDRIIYDPRTALEYEMNIHTRLSDRKMYLIQRKDVLFMEKENPHFEKLCTI